MSKRLSRSVHRFGSLQYVLGEGKIAIGFGVNKLRGSAPAILADSIGFDFLFIDMEHSSISVESASEVAQAASGLGITPLVRCCKEAVFDGVRLLDNGAAGLVIPHINTAAEARNVVLSCRYPPQGNRSFSSLQPQIGYTVPNWEALGPELNEETLVFLMIETVEACRNLDEILGVENFNGILIGASDLSASMGHPGQPNHPEVVEACIRTAVACRTAGRILAIAGVTDKNALARLYAEGVLMFLGGTDLGFMRAGAADALAKIRASVTSSGSAE
jgi:2-keto-3-deoxy-L-rhamnonate aldolase RhmA